MNLKKYVQESNAKFEAGSKAEKRVMIAKDVIKRLDTKNLIATTGALVRLKDINKSFEQEDSLKELINDSEGCSVCGKGSLLCAYVGRVNKFSIEDIEGNNEISDNIHKKLLKLFTARQLDLIETAFEGISYLNVINQFKDDDKAVDFYEDYPEPDERLRAIMHNLISNNGTFKP